MKPHLTIYTLLLCCLTIAGTGQASAFVRLGSLNNMHGHRIAPPKFHSIQIIKPPLAPSIKIGTPMYQPRPRQK